jgi:acetaldehyde dehydrogenase
MMRDTVYVLSEAASQQEIAASIAEMAAAVQAYVPGYRLKQQVQFEVIPKISRSTCRALAASPA